MICRRGVRTSHRRDPAYIGWYVRASSATGGRHVPLRWRLPLAEDPALPAPEVRILWRADLDPGALRVQAQPTGLRDPARLPIHLLRDWLAFTGGHDGREHAVLSDGLRHLRLDVEVGTLSEGPVVLRYRRPSRASREAGTAGRATSDGALLRAALSGEPVPAGTAPGALDRTVAGERRTAMRCNAPRSRTAAVWSPANAGRMGGAVRFAAVTHPPARAPGEQFGRRRIPQAYARGFCVPSKKGGR